MLTIVDSVAHGLVLHLSCCLAHNKNTLHPWLFDRIPAARKRDENEAYANTAACAQCEMTLLLTSVQSWRRAFTNIGCCNNRLNQ